MNNKPRILFVDDDASILNALRRFTRQYEWHCEFCDSPVEALALQVAEPFDVIVSDMRMPGVNGTKLLAQCASIHRDSIRILLTGYADMDALIDTVNQAQLFTYIAKPWEDHLLADALSNAVRYSDTLRENQRLQRTTRRQNELLLEINSTLEEKIACRTEQLQAALNRLKNQHHALGNQFQQMVDVLVGLVDQGEGQNHPHSKVVADYCQSIADQLELDKALQQDLYLAALLHDIGLLGFSAQIKHRPIVMMSKRKRQEYQRHCQIGESIMQQVGANESIGAIIRSHHEKLDGSGYPDALAGKQIPIGARILCVVNDYHDLVHGLLAERPLSSSEAVHYLKHTCSHHYDQTVVEALVNLLETPSPLTLSCRTIRTAQLVSGMRLARDIISESGLLLLSAGQVMQPQAIYRLRRYEKETGTVLPIVIEVSHHIGHDELLLEKMTQIA